MNLIDMAIVGLIALSAVISIFRGFIREVLSLVAWVAAFYVAFRFYPMGVDALSPHIDSELVRLFVAFLGIFISVLIVFSLLNYVIAKLVDGTGLSGTDRFLGVLFGIVRGAAIAIVLIIIVELTPFTEQKIWKSSSLVPQLKTAAEWVKGYLPDDITQHLNSVEKATEQLPNMEQIESTMSNLPPTDGTEAE